MLCKRCGNTDPSYFYHGSKGVYCRKCICFKRALLEEDLKSVEYDIEDDVFEYQLRYELTSFQKEISLKCLESLKKQDVFLHCVCGSGKTEIVLDSISYYLKNNLKVCYAIARREVVKELYLRFKDYFNKAKVIALYGGHHNEIKADLIVCTIHQLFRYYQTFDLLIVDEADAYPLKDNDTLMNIALNASKGRIIFSSATINSFLKGVMNKRKAIELELLLRPHLKPLIVPKLFYGFKLYLYCLMFYLLKKAKGQYIIFLPSKKLCKDLYLILKNFLSITYVYADLKQRDENIKAFKEKKYQFILATSLLERGITIKDINVIILAFDHYFDETNLAQMVGRVGRNINNPYGESFILTNCYDQEILNTINYLKEANRKSAMYLL